MHDFSHDTLTELMESRNSKTAEAIKHIKMSPEKRKYILEVLTPVLEELAAAAMSRMPSDTVL
jgi:hypothetical protein